MSGEEPEDSFIMSLSYLAGDNSGNDMPTAENAASFHVGPVPVYGDVILAPMAGYADVPHRKLCGMFGSSMNYTEFIAVEDVIHGAPSVMRLADFAPDEYPNVIQLFGSDAGRFLEAALKVEELEPDIIDINMGCSTRRVSGRGAGVGMMPQPELVAETFNLLSKRLSVPVSGKIRLGWNADQNYLQIARIMEDQGASLIAMHPRTKEQGYHGSADWDAITELCQEVSIPVIGSGDVRSPAGIDVMLRSTGCQAVMVGRGAIGNPWIFSRLDKSEIDLEQILETIRMHVQMMVDYHGPVGLLRFRKYLKRYLEQEEGLDDVLGRMLTTEDLDEFLILLPEIAESRGVPHGRIRG
jgi:tRNA-dihydrouridine synthase B